MARMIFIRLCRSLSLSLAPRRVPIALLTEAETSEERGE